MSVGSSARPWRDPRFEPGQFLGRGNSGVVYSALDRETGAEIALKTFRERDPEGLYRLKQEFRACAGVRHRNLVELYELAVTDDDCFFTMELVDGVDFVRHVRQGADDEAHLVVRFLAAAHQLVQGLAALHAAGRLHRDVKPPNALVDRAGRVVLLDFGFMVAFGGRVLAIERSDTIAGSLAYMAPEILWGAAASPASDWYSVGVVFHEALSGALPFEGAPARLLSRDARPLPAPLPAGVPPILRELVEALLSAEPERRPGAGEIATVIATCSAEQRTAAQPPSPLAEELPFVGRDAELAELRAAAADLAAGASSVVRICGPSGIGKSELVRRFLGEVEQGEDAVVLGGRCHPYEAVPYRAFDGLVDSLSRYLVALAEASAAALAPRHAAAMIRLFPVLGRVPALAGWQQTEGEGGDAQERRRRGFAALRELLARLGDRQRLVLWIDDVQWADADSVALARELFGGADPPRLLVLLTYRSEDRAAAEAFATFEGGEREQPVRSRCIELAPLGEGEARVLAERFAGGRLGDVSPVVREAGGSPFFLGQLVRHLLSAPGEVAQGLPQVMQARLDQLGVQARSLLEVVAVAGAPIDPGVALRAASLLSASRREMITLQEERLLRLTPAAGHAVEVYHDRVRESVLATLSPGALRERHRGLAHTLVREPEPDPQALYRHFLGAGETAPAADWAVEAAEHADRALAFAEAAELYRAAAELREPGHPGGHLLTRKRATALANAGRGGEAAPLFLAAAAESAGEDALDLRRQAAEQFMQTGHLDEGIACLQALLPAVGLRYPGSTAGAAIATLASLGAIALGRERGAARPNGRRPTNGIVRMVTARSAAKGLAMVDPFRGLYFAVRALALSLREGDPHLVARGLAEVGATLVPAGPPLAAWAGRMLDRAHRMAAALDDPYLMGLTSITLAQKCMVEGRWAAMLDLCDHGATILRDQCRGVSWEVAIAGAAAERALEELGHTDAILRRASAALQQAQQADDMVRTCSCHHNIGVVRLLQGRTDDARMHAERVRQRWTPSGFHMQHFYSLRLDAYCDLLEGAVAVGWQRVVEAWPALQRSNLLRHALIGVDAHLLRARLALALAAPGSRQWSALRRGVERDIREIERRGGAHNAAHGRLLRASLAHRVGDLPSAVRGAGEAAASFERHDMPLLAAAARRLVGACAATPARPAERRETSGVREDVTARIFTPGASVAPLTSP